MDFIKVLDNGSIQWNSLVGKHIKVIESKCIEEVFFYAFDSTTKILSVEVTYVNMEKDIHYIDTTEDNVVTRVRDLLDLQISRQKNTKVVYETNEYVVTALTKLLNDGHTTLEGLDREVKALKMLYDVDLEPCKGMSIENIICLFY